MTNEDLRRLDEAAEQGGGDRYDYDICPYCGEVYHLYRETCCQDKDRE